MWSEKYKPRKLAMMVGNEASRLRFYRWLKNWKPKTKPVMLIGSPGTGKTTIVHLVAEELGYTLVELNASDFRSKSVLDGKSLEASYCFRAAISLLETTLLKSIVILHYAKQDYTFCGQTCLSRCFTCLAAPALRTQGLRKRILQG